MSGFAFLFLTILSSSFSTDNQQEQSDLHLVHYTGAKENIIDLLAQYGYTYKRQIVPDFYHFIRKPVALNSFSNDADVYKRLMWMDKKLVSIHSEKPLIREKRSVPKYQFVIEDAEWSKQWHLHTETVPSMNIKEAWEDGMSGTSIMIAIVDDGIDTSHADLALNYNSSVSYDYVQDDEDSSHANSEESHGTNCAGIAAASKNDQCVIGTAYAASIAAIRLLEIGFNALASQEALALTHRLDAIDIYSNSWGPRDDGKGFDESDALQDVQIAALVEGISEGRNGKGAIYTWASGNGGKRFDDCNVDGYSNSMYTISVAALAPDSSPAWYSEECTAILTATYGGDNTKQTIATTHADNGCIDTFQGTSAACPMASGIIALVLQTNKELTWRDIQHLIVETSLSTTDVKGNFYTNAAGKKVSLTHGFGLMNAAALVNTSKTWNTVPERIKCEGNMRNTHSSADGKITLTDSYTLHNCFINYMEHVLIHIKFKFLWREGSSIFITSPQRTTSRILRQRKLDDEASTVQWTFMSVHSWGEEASGTWTLQLVSTEPRNNMTLYSWKVEAYGTVTNPLAGTPNGGQIGGFCDHYNPCVDTVAVCLEDYYVCINCSGGFHLIDGKCVKDGTLSGYCDDSTECIKSVHGCNSSSNVCVVCEDDHRVINGFCIKDGTLGGYCNADIECLGIDIGCEARTKICVKCTNGYSIINNYCIQDGTLGGYCNSSVPCNVSTIGCTEESICIICTTNHHVIDGFCIKDGSNGGYCDGGIICTEWLGCNVSTNRCQKCGPNYTAINGYCIEDGTLGGYCDGNTSYCIANTSCMDNICIAFKQDTLFLIPYNGTKICPDETICIVVIPAVCGVAIACIAIIVLCLANKRKRMCSRTIRPDNAPITKSDITPQSNNDPPQSNNDSPLVC